MKKKSARRRPDPSGPRDRVFDEEQSFVQDFKFDRTVATVFDDMVNRSVPMYGEFQRMIQEMTRDFAVDGTRIYDLGCATGTTLALVDRAVEQNVTLVGIDDSPNMLEKCRTKLGKVKLRHPLELIEADINHGVTIEGASAVLMVLTLQFVRPLHREAVVRSIFEGLHAGGCLILVEKVLGEDSTFNRLFIEYYYELKRRRGYSQMEISQKREALENVLIPYKLSENLSLLKRTGFRATDVFFKWYNFCGIIAIK